MVSPKPVSLTQVDTEDYDGAFEPQPLIVVGPIPGGGGGGGAVDSVNGKTGDVVLTLDDVVGDTGATDGVIGVVNSLTSPTQTTVIQSSSVTVQNTTTNRNTSVTPGDIYLSAGGNRAQLTAPSSGGTATVITLPGTSGTVALTSDLTGLAPYTALNAVGDATVAAQATADEALGKANTAVQPAAIANFVPNTRTVAGKSLSANVTLVKGDVGLGSVDNTSDASKPVSSATQTALNAKVAGLNGVTGLWKGTQVQYDAIVSKDANVVYVISG